MNEYKNVGTTELNQGDLNRMNAFFGQGTFSEKIDADPNSLARPLYNIGLDNLHPFPHLNNASEYLEQTLLQFQQAQLNLFKNKDNANLKQEIDKQVLKFFCKDAVELFKKYSENDGLVSELYSEYKEVHKKETPEVQQLNNSYQEFKSAYGEFRTQFLDEISACAFDEQHKLGIVEKHSEYVFEIDSKTDKTLSSSAFMVGDLKQLEFAADHFSNLAETKTKEFQDFNNPAQKPKAANSKDLDI